MVCVEIIGLGIFICHKNQAPPKDCSWNTDYFLCAVTYLLMWDLNTASSFWLDSASLWCHQWILLLWWVMEMNVCKVVWLCGNNQLHSTVFKGTLNKHWNTERTTSAIKRKMVSSKLYKVINEANPYLLGVWPQKIIRIQYKLNDNHLIFKVQDQH